MLINGSLLPSASSGLASPASAPGPLAAKAHRVNLVLKLRVVGRARDWELRPPFQGQDEWGNMQMAALPPRLPGRACPLAARPACLTPLWACHMKGFALLLPAPAARSGWGCSHQKTKISFRPGQSEAPAGPGNAVGGCSC